MKVRLLPLVLSLVGGALVTVVGRSAPVDEKIPFVWLDGADPAAAGILAVGDRAIDHYGRSLLSEVKRSLNAMTPALAVPKVHLKEYKIPPAVPGQPLVTAVKRTSLNLRSWANAPDAADRAALDLIKRALDVGDDIPKVLLQKIELPGQPVEYRVFRPLGLTPQCIACHGASASLDSEVKAALSVLFPDDKAVDYSPGAWRGLIRVSVAMPAKP